MAILGKDKIIAMNEQDLEKLLDSIDFKNLTADQITGENGLLKLLTKRIIQKAMTSEIDDHLGYTKHDPEGRNSGNSRNGKSKKTIITDQGDLQIEIPRDRNGEFEPQIIKKTPETIRRFR